jgi:3-oxoacid CoA-transferase subunit A
MRPESLPEYEKAERFGGIVYIEDEFPNLLFAMDGEVYNLGGMECMPIGGAYSVAGSRWEDSQPSEEIKDRVEEALHSRGWEIDVIFSHTCPWKHMPWDELSPHIKQEQVDNSTEKWLDTIEDRLDYDEWYCGHFHIDKWAGKLKFVNIGEFVELN